MLKLMIVDDEPMILRGLMNIIEKGSTPCSEIVSASDGFEALEKLEDFRPDLLITDINMPEMTGLELIKNAQSKGFCKRFVILTGYDETVYLHQAIRCKVIDYLLKPINKTELYDVLTNLSVELLSTVNKKDTPPIYISDSPLQHLDYGQMSKNIRKIIQYIEENYATDISLDQLADYVYLHPNYISSLFKKETGLTFIHYLHLFRIKKAKELMINDKDLSFHQISDQVGYENVRHFFNVFKKYSGETPGKFRELYKIH
ncbi:response regulator [Mesobacillus foraminis]|uniref:response regulator transcription factor n=1 Tax=Mesobacillus foraminis TaxID=279826 RepID=UPI001BEBF7E5|nr:response regulator [Mesobacillus foraminis]MBT2757801.1 response regulator [Mesobacillus foraminis]